MQIISVQIGLATPLYRSSRSSLRSAPLYGGLAPLGALSGRLTGGGAVPAQWLILAEGAGQLVSEAVASAAETIGACHPRCWSLGQKVQAKLLALRLHTSQATTTASCVRNEQLIVNTRCSDWVG